MTNAQISCLFAVVKYKSFSKAADHLYISQSAISKNISTLEKSVGYLLIDRTGGTVKLTEIGQMFYDYYVKTEEEYKELLREIENITNNKADDINLGCLDGWDLSQFYPQTRNVFREKYPGIKINLEGYNHIDILDALTEKKIDIAITLATTLPGNGKFVSRTIAKAPAIILYSASHHLAGKEDLQLKDFKDETFYIIAPNSQESNPMENLCVMLCRNAGFEPKLEYAPNSATILMRLQNGSGVQITCDWTCAAHFSIYNVTKLNYMLNVNAVWLDDGRTPAKHIFINELMRLNIGKQEYEIEQD